MYNLEDKILVDEKFFNDRCYKATDRLIKLCAAGDRLEEILKGADQLDKWNGFGSGYVYIREEIEEMSKKLKDSAKP